MEAPSSLRGSSYTKPHARGGDDDEVFVFFGYRHRATETIDVVNAVGLIFVVRFVLRFGCCHCGHELTRSNIELCECFMAASIA